MTAVGWKRIALSSIALCLLLLASALYLGFLVIDGAITHTYMEQGYADTKEDLALLSRVAPELRKGFTKLDVLTILRDLEPDGLIVEEANTVSLHGLVFEFGPDGRLESVGRL